MIAQGSCGNCGLGIAPLVVGGVVAGSAAAGAAVWPWISKESSLLCQILGMCDDPKIVPPDLTPVAPQVGQFTPEMMSVYTGERVKRDFTISQGVARGLDVKGLPSWLPLAAVGLGLIVLVRR